MQARGADMQARGADVQAREGDVQAREGDVQAREGDVQAREGDVQARGGGGQARGLCFPQKTEVDRPSSSCGAGRGGCRTGAKLRSRVPAHKGGARDRRRPSTISTARALPPAC
jgi:uncharacterized protein (DUF3084 family)